MYSKTKHAAAHHQAGGPYRSTVTGVPYLVGSPHILFCFTATLVLLVTMHMLQSTRAPVHEGFAAGPSSLSAAADATQSIETAQTYSSRALVLSSMPAVFVATGRISSCTLIPDKLPGLGLGAGPAAKESATAAAFTSDAAELIAATAILQLECAYSLGGGGGGGSISGGGSTTTRDSSGEGVTRAHQQTNWWQMQQHITVTGVDNLTCAMHAEGASSAAGSGAKPAGNRYSLGKQQLPERLQHYVFLLHRPERKPGNTAFAYQVVEYAALPADESSSAAMLSSFLDEWGEAVHPLGCFSTATNPAAPDHPIIGGDHQLQQQQQQQKQQHAALHESSSSTAATVQRQLLQSTPAPPPVTSPPTPAAASASATPPASNLALWDQCGGTSNCASYSPCADGPWSTAGSGCPAGSSCERENESYWQCRTIAAEPPAAAPQNSTTAAATAAPPLGLGPASTSSSPRKATAADVASPLQTSSNSSVTASINANPTASPTPAKNGTLQGQQQPAVRAASGPPSSSKGSSQKDQPQDSKAEGREQDAEPAVVLLDESGRSVLGAGSANASLAATRLLCALQPEVGPCRASIPRWAFAVPRGRCESFTWGGCSGNDNNFATKELCEATCAGSMLSAPWTSNSTSNSSSNGDTSMAGEPAAGAASVPVPFEAVMLPDRILVDNKTGGPGSALGGVPSGANGLGGRQGLGFAGAVVSAAVLILI